MDILEAAKIIGEVGLTVASIAALIVVWKEFKEERSKRDEQAEQLKQSFLKMVEVIATNTEASKQAAEVLDRVDNFIRHERGDK